jgi:cytochrome c biogenesis protein CcmG/thiol:disulfide interchange protein DsbE
MTVTAPPAPADQPSSTPPSRTHTARWIAAVVGVVVALFIVLLATRPSADEGSADSPLLGKEAPATGGVPISFSGASDGSGPSEGSNGSAAAAVSLDTFTGKYVLVNFFASWCIPCQDEQPALTAFNEAHSKTGDAAVLGVVYDDTASNVRRFVEEHGGGWPIIDSSKAKVDWGVRGVPESFLVDPDGVVLYHIVGGVKQDMLETLLAQSKQVRAQRQSNGS